MDDWTADHFTPLIGQSFFVTDDNGVQVALALSRVVGQDTGAPDVDRNGHRLRSKAFSLILEGPPAPVLETLTYQMDIPELGAHHLFVSPFSAGSDGVSYEIVFS